MPTEGGRESTISRIVSSGSSPGPPDISDTSPNAAAPKESATCASSGERMQQILTWTGEMTIDTALSSRTTSTVDKIAHVGPAGKTAYSVPFQDSSRHRERRGARPGKVAATNA